MAEQNDGRAALVTGAASGIGRAAAEIFARKGYRVVAADLDVDAGKETVTRIRDAGGEARFLQVDVSDDAAVAEMVRTAVATYGRLDAAMNNAGISDPERPFVDIPLEDWHRMIAVNLTGVFLCLQHEIRQMLAQEPRQGQRGAIVNTSSGAGLVAAPGQPHYTAAKHGVLGVTRCAAGEYRERGIRVNAICPGLIDTKMLRESMKSSPMLAQMAQMAQNMLGQPEDVAAAAVWLCSDEARWISGQALVIDRGVVMH